MLSYFRSTLLKHCIDPYCLFPYLSDSYVESLPKLTYAALHLGNMTIFQHFNTLTYNINRAFNYFRSTLLPHCIGPYCPFPYLSDSYDESLPKLTYAALHLENRTNFQHLNTLTSYFNRDLTYFISTLL